MLQQGSVIDYAVALEIREGANNVSGKVLKEIAVDASENGKCTIEELPIGTYTIRWYQQMQSSKLLLRRSV